MEQVYEGHVARLVPKFSFANGANRVFFFGLFDYRVTSQWLFTRRVSRGQWLISWHRRSLRPRRRLKTPTRLSYQQTTVKRDSLSIVAIETRIFFISFSYNIHPLRYILMKGMTGGCQNGTDDLNVRKERSCATKF